MPFFEEILFIKNSSKHGKNSNVTDKNKLFFVKDSSKFAI